VKRSELPELASASYEALVASETVLWRSAPLRARPAVVALVDTSCDDSFLDLVRTSLHAALLASGPHALFGLATLSGRLQLWDLQAAGPPVARSVALHHATAAVPLSDVLPLPAFLTSVGCWRDSIEAAIDALRPAPPAERANCWHADDPGRNEEEEEEEEGDLRCLGPAMDALITYLAACCPPGAPAPLAHQVAPPATDAFPALRLLVFLSGPPRGGAGAPEAARWAEAQAALFPASLRDGALPAAAAAADALGESGSAFYLQAGERAAVRRVASCFP